MSAFGVDLAERLSNPQVTILFQRLTGRVSQQDPCPAQRLPVGAPDGRRPFGVVGDAVTDALTHARAALRVRDVHAHVEQILGGEVSRSSVRSFLHRRSRGRTPMFERIARDSYRLRR